VLWEMGVLQKTLLTLVLIRMLGEEEEEEEEDEDEDEMNIYSWGVRAVWEATSKQAGSREGGHWDSNRQQ